MVKTSTGSKWLVVFGLCGVLWLWCFVFFFLVSIVSDGFFCVCVPSPSAQLDWIEVSAPRWAGFLPLWCFQNQEIETKHHATTKIWHRLLHRMLSC